MFFSYCNTILINPFLVLIRTGLENVKVLWFSLYVDCRRWAAKKRHNATNNACHIKKNQSDCRVDCTTVLNRAGKFIEVFGGLEWSCSSADRLKSTVRGRIATRRVREESQME